MAKTKEERAAYARDYYRNKMTPEQLARKRETNLAWGRSKRGKESTRQWRERNKFKVATYSIQNGAKYRAPDRVNKESLSDETIQEWLVDKWEQPCRYCGAPSTSVDHVIPLARGGGHNLANFDLICPTCNIAKKDRTPEEFIDWIKKAAEYINSAGELPPLHEV